MPLLKSKSKKAFESNLKEELGAGKPKDQSLAIAYSIKRKAPKKYAEGGKITADSQDADELGMVKNREISKPVTSAASEKRPTIHDITPEELEMIHSHRLAFAEGGKVPNFKDEGMDSIDEDQTNHGKSMLEGASTMGRKEKDWTADGRTTIDDAGTDRDEHMISGNRPGHSQVSRAASGRPTADDALDMVDTIMKKRKMFAEGGRVEDGQVDLQKNNGDEDKNNLDDLNWDAIRKETYYDDGQLSDQPEDSNMHGHDLSDEDSHDMVEQIRRKMKMRKVGQ